MTLTRYRLGNLIEIVDEKNNLGIRKFYGININKEIMPTNAKTENLNEKKYKLLRKNRFVYSGMQTGRDKSIRISMYFGDEPVIVSPAYTTFEIKDENIILPIYFFMLFQSKEKDRLGWFYSDSSVRANLDWDRFCDIKIDLPPLDIQKKYVAIYKAMLENQAAYEKCLEDLKLACDASMDKLKENYKLTRINEILKIVDIRNKNLDTKEISGLNIEKRFIKSNSNINENGLRNYKIVKQDELVFSGMQTGRDKCIRIALNTTNNNLIVSPAYNVFSINKNIINPKYLMLWFSRNEVDRYGWFISDSSIRSNLDLDRFYEMEIPLPPITIQNSIANIYKVYTDRKEINEKLKERLKNICPILIKGAVEEAKRKEA